MSFIIGIDPGQKGAVVCIDSRGVVRWAHVMPDNPAILSHYLDYGKSKGSPLHVFVEKAQAMPGQGVSSMFNYGVGFGTILGLLVAKNIPHTLVQPRQWAKAMHVGTKAQEPKKRSLEACQRLAPSLNLLATPRSKVAHIGIVDAYLIAEYGRRLLLGQG